MPGGAWSGGLGVRWGGRAGGLALRSHGLVCGGCCWLLGLLFAVGPAVWRWGCCVRVGVGAAVLCRCCASVLELLCRGWVEAAAVLCRCCDSVLELLCWGWV